MARHELLRPTVKEVQDTLNKEGEIICKWCKSNLLKGNFEKYQIMSMGLEDKTKYLEITMSNVKIKCGSDLSLLGLQYTKIEISGNMSVKYANEQKGKRVF